MTINGCGDNYRIMMSFVAESVAFVMTNRKKRVKNAADAT